MSVSYEGNRVAGTVETNCSEVHYMVSTVNLKRYKDITICIYIKIHTMPAGKMVRYSRGKSSQSTAVIARRALRLAKKVNKKDILYVSGQSIGGALATTTGTVINLQYPQSVVGYSVKPMTMNLRGYITQNASATDTVVRFIVLQYHSDGAPGASDILYGDGLTYKKSIVHRHDFTILSDRYYLLSAVKPIALVNINIKPRRKIHYAAPSSSTVDSDGIYLLYYSDQATNKPTLTLKYDAYAHDSD